MRTLPYVLLAVACSEPDSAPTVEHPAELVMEGEQLLSSDSQRALDNIQRAIELEPGNARWKSALVRAALEVGETQLALETLTSIEETEWTHEHRAWRLQACSEDRTCAREALLAQAEADDRPKREIGDALVAIESVDDARAVYMEAFEEDDGSVVRPLLELLLSLAEDRLNSLRDVPHEDLRWSELLELRGDIERVKLHEQTSGALRTRADTWIAEYVGAQSDFRPVDPMTAGGRLELPPLNPMFNSIGGLGNARDLSESDVIDLETLEPSYRSRFRGSEARGSGARGVFGGPMTQAPTSIP